MRESVFTIVHNRPMARDVYEMRLAGDARANQSPGQFVNLRLPELFLRRPFSVSDADDAGLTIAYKRVGRGTEAMARMSPGETLDLLTGLGNGFSTRESGTHPLVVAGGTGVPPMLMLARRLRAEGKTPIALLGFASAADVFYLRELEQCCARVLVATADGSLGARGLVTDLLAEAVDGDYLYACGPEAMLRALYERWPGDGQFSFEEHMGCGFGACMGCSRLTKTGAKRLCKDGPVLYKEEIAWPTQA